MPRHASTTFTVPVLCSGGHIAQWISPEQAAAYPPCRLLRSRRGHIVRVLPPVDTPWTLDLIERGKSSRWGQGFHQPLDSGHVWALRGVEGSRRGA